MEQDLLSQLLAMALGKLGIVPQFVAALLSIQSVNKALQIIWPALKELVSSTTTPADDAILEKIEKSKLKESLKWAVDFLLRIKL